MLYAFGIAVGVMSGVILLFVGVNYVLSAGDGVNERLDRFARRRKSSEAQPKEERESIIGARLDRAIAKQTFGQKMARDLARADLKLTVSEYLVLNGLTTFFGGLLGYAITRELFIAIVGLGIGFIIPGLVVGQRQKRRLRAFNDQLGDTITLLANSLRSGYSLLQSMDMAARESPQPTAEEFRRVVREVGFGLSPEEALANLVRRISSDDLDLMVSAMNVQHEVGGNLAQILETIGNTIRERVRIKGEISTLTAQQQYAGYIVAALPILLTLFLFLLNKEYMLPMFSGVYLCMPIGGVVLIVIGFMVIRKIVSIQV